MPRLKEAGSLSCPFCTDRHSTVFWTTAPDDLPASLAGLNIIRRGRKCTRCGSNYTTIELLEEEFDQLKRPPRRGAVRPALGGKF